MNLRPEYPRPSFRRDRWLNLNGKWEFSLDNGVSGDARGYATKPHFDSSINVPYCPESQLSGIKNIDFMPSVWYAKDFDLTEEQLCHRILLHCGACDYATQVYVNGTKVGAHEGGYSSFSFEISAYLCVGKNRIVIHALDDVRSHRQPRGKQSEQYFSAGCDYTRTTGIWQTVWLEFLPDLYLKNIRIDATDLSGRVYFQVFLSEYAEDTALRVEVRWNDLPAGTITCPLEGTVTNAMLEVSPVHFWAPGQPNLYDVKYTLLRAGKEIDQVYSYFGIRRIDISGQKILINGKPVFQRLILDQGFYPDGIYTAPTDDALRKDIELSMRLGFNGARLHQKIFEERYLYHADRLGYIVWGEYPSWGVDYTQPHALHSVLPEWLECIERDFNHPCIVAWCPWNETWNKAQISSNISVVYSVTKAADPTRPVIDSSGGFHAFTDIFDVHDYEQDPTAFAERYTRHANGDYFDPFPGNQSAYTGSVPYIVSEFGGTRWKTNETYETHSDAWGYGNAPKTPEEFCERYCRLIETLLKNPSISGFCYTQLTDVEQEQNGLYNYDRTNKFSDEIYELMRRSTSKRAAIERE